MHRRALLAVVFLTACRETTQVKPTAPYADAATDGLSWALVDDLGSTAVGLASHDSTTWAVVDNTVLESTDGGGWLSLPTTGLPDAPILWLGAAGATPLIEVDGSGLFRWTGSTWAAPETAPASGLITGFNPRARPIPYGAAGGSKSWLAAAGGLFSSSDDGNIWSAVTLSPEAGFNLLFTDIVESGSTVMATAMLPAGLLPDEFAGFLNGVVFRSDDGGNTWVDAAPELPFRYATGVTLDASGSPHVAALDGGLHSWTGDTWQALGGPSDALSVSAFGEGISVISATRGVWRKTDTGWQGAGDSPMVGLTQTLALARDGRLYKLADHEPTAGVPTSDAKVHIALSFHVNLYHSYRGDSNTDDGYGIDLDVMRNTMDWLERHPRARADWDFETHFSLGEWMQTDGADVLARLQQRVASGTDEVRPMSWNNGAMANHTEAEFKTAMERAADDLDATFGGHVPGVQPQECMFTADHLSWYPEAGIDWVTLFYSGTPFTALRFDHDLPASTWYNPFSLTDPDSSASLTTVPVYHHADMVNHGGLAGWARQIHENHTGDQLLVIHFDADAESWQAFEQELAAAETLDFVEFTLLSDYVDTHPATESIELVGDMADGTGDGFQSWAEKDFNHTLATTIHQAREVTTRAEALLDAVDTDTAAQARVHLDAALDARLLSLSTTHFGLAAPVLHPDRVASATAFADTALSEAQSALDLLTAALPPAAGELKVHNPHPYSGSVVVAAPLAVPAEVWSEHGLGGVWLSLDGTAVPAEVTVVNDSTDPIQLQARFVLAMPALDTITLAWGADGSVPPGTGDATAATLFDGIPLTTPFTECAGSSEQASAPTATPPAVDEHAVVTTDIRTWDLPFCSQPGPDALTWTAERFSGFEGTIWTVEAAMPDATGGTATEDDPWNLDAESVALSPLTCSGPATTVRWHTFGGTTRTRPVRQDQPTWNGQAIDGFLSLACESGTTIEVAHDGMTRTSLAMAPLRTTDGQAILAPLGTLWGDPVRHDVRRSGGHGAGDVITPVVGSQFRPAAPDWSGKSIRYRLLVGTDGQLDDGTLYLFSHPPMVQVGEHVAPSGGDTGDTGTPDTGSGDTGSGDTGSGDTGSGDTGNGDTGTTDTASP